MKKLLKIDGFNLSVTAYLIVFILTFGYSFNDFEFESETEMVATSFLVSMVFPLYWSVKLFED